MNWIYFPYFAFASTLLWVISIVLLYTSNSKALRNISIFLTSAGILILSLFILLLWLYLERPPLKTLGETRLWYSFFLPTIGFITYLRWRYKWFLSYSLGLAILFLSINYLNPDTHDKTLMPALQSIWFVPHVIVYIFAYALLAASSLVSLKGLYHLYFKDLEKEVTNLADNLVYIGFAFLTLGLLFGALWAKKAWGSYWTWDPKETWAFITWLGYLLYIHFRHNQPKKTKVALWILALAFVVLLICWFGINYLPSAQNSIHTYSN